MRSPSGDRHRWGAATVRLACRMIFRLKTAAGQLVLQRVIPDYEAIRATVSMLPCLTLDPSSQADKFCKIFTVGTIFPSIWWVLLHDPSNLNEGHTHHPMNDVTANLVIPGALLGAGDPPPFTLVNPDGQSPVVLVCDHASNVIPTALDQLGLGPEALSRHIAWDIGAARVARLLAARLDGPAVLAGYSRLVIDCNRSPGDPTSIAEVSDGTFIPGNRNLDDAAAESRLNEVFWPYHHAITQILAHRWRHGHGRTPALIAIHSFTPMLNGFRRPWQLGVLWNRDPRLALPVLARFRTDPELCVGDNEPYSGREVGFTMDTHGGAAGLPHVEIEIRQDLIADDAGCERWATVVGDALAAVLADQTLYRVQHY